MSDERLTDDQYWDSMHKNRDKKPSEAQESKSEGGLYSRLFPKLAKGYAGHILFDVKLNKHLEKGPLKLLEIGSAPGEKLVSLHKSHGHIPFGVEYSETGEEQNRKLFEKNGIDPDNVILSDFFDKAFHDKNHEQYDIVMSHGFIEHFDDTSDVISKHLNLLKPGGALLITIPNFRWFNHALISFFSPQALPAHNLAIMNKTVLQSHLDLDQVDLLECKYVGTLNMNLIYGKNKGPVKLLLMKLVLILQRLIDIFLILIAPRGGLESAFFSPYILLLAKKKKRS